MSIIYLASLTLLGVCSMIGQRIDQGARINQPLNPLPLKVVSAISGIVALPLIIAGFFLYQWWMPLLGMLCVAIPGGVIAGILQRKHFAPLAAFICGLLGIALAIAAVLTT